MKETRSLFLVLFCMVLAGACGKKGNPLPPLQRIPAPIADLTVTRIDQDVFARFTVPTTNIDGIGPADIARVELYALTTDRPPLELRQQDAEELRKIATLVASELVRKPPPTLPPVKEGMPPPPPLPPPGPGVDQGSVVVMRETLQPEMQTLVTLPDPFEPRDVEEPVETMLSLPLVAPTDVSGPLRYYFAVGVSPRERYGPPSTFAPAPLGPTSSAPPQPQVDVKEKSMTLRWTPAPDARGVIPPTPEGLLPSTPIVRGIPPTTYDVYEVPSNATPPTPVNASPPGPEASALSVPTGLTPAPIGALELDQPGITLGTERCFFVRPVDIINGLHVRGPASPVVCASFADTFPPNPPSSLAAVARPGDIGLIWEPSDSPDVAGYLVLRGTAADEKLSPVTEQPVTATTYTDASVKPGVRYIYAVVAVDKAGNRSEESNRAEETARQ